MARWWGFYFQAALQGQALAFVYWCALQDEAAELIAQDLEDRS